MCLGLVGITGLDTVPVFRFFFCCHLPSPLSPPLFLLLYFLSPQLDFTFIPSLSRSSHPTHLLAHYNDCNDCYYYYNTAIPLSPIRILLIVITLASLGPHSLAHSLFHSPLLIHPLASILLVTRTHILPPTPAFHSHSLHSARLDTRGHNESQLQPVLPELPRAERTTHPASSR